METLFRPITPPGYPQGSDPTPPHLPNQQCYVCCAQPEPEGHLTQRFYVGKKYFEVVIHFSHFFPF